MSLSNDCVSKKVIKYVFKVYLLLFWYRDTQIGIVLVVPKSSITQH